MWFMAAMGVAQALGGLFGANDAAKAQRIINKANAEAENLVRKARNEYEVATVALSNTMRSARNKNLLTAAGGQYNAIGQNIVRLEDQSVKGKIELRVAAAEQLGELSAASSSMGVGGSVVDLIENTMVLQQARAEREADTQLRYQTGDMKAQRDVTILNAVNQMDNGQDIANMDYSKSIAGFVAKPSAFGAIVQGLSAAAPYLQAGFLNNKMNAAQKQQTVPMKSSSMWSFGGSTNQNITTL